MILVVSALIAAEESALLDPIAPLQDDDVSKKLLDDLSVTLESMVPEPAEGDDSVHEELDSLTALLSVFSGPEPLESSPQATRRANKDAKNASKNFWRFISSFFLCPYQITDN